MNKTENQENKEPNQQQQPLLACQEELAAVKDKYLRVTADLENFTRRIEKEKVQWIGTGQAAVLTDLLEVVDNFDRALKEYEKKQTAETHPWFEGFQMMYKGLTKILAKYGVTEIEEKNQFDPMLHEALVQIDSTDHKPGEIVEIFEKGYRFKNTVLRPAKVSVAK